ncbi:uncharacterized protein F5147DRAFT_678825 [Suillus discolor]|uniref:Uncharacterized protein n=1 Tax=Suillus discolor TaxID=1912936 RepID=A0A9P7JXG1_9AGAM|nr:uncharacterized protein F5147DRAFT_678825 [Suillus discolor]KAG2114282.1 hypothetical protein F5147DRAFT_678825 [Suillus discolor]
MKALYIVTRYLPFIFLATDLYLYCAPNENPSKCRVLENTESGLGIVLVIVSEIFFILRTYVLWHKNRLLLATMLSTFFIVLAVSFSIAFTTGVPAACTRSHLPSGVP